MDEEKPGLHLVPPEWGSLERGVWLARRTPESDEAFREYWAYWDWLAVHDPEKCRALAAWTAERDPVPPGHFFWKRGPKGPPPTPEEQAAFQAEMREAAARLRSALDALLAKDVLSFRPKQPSSSTVPTPAKPSQET